MWHPGEDAWLAGFADGEASFNICFKRRPGHRLGAALYPRFAIHARADDVAILRSCQGAIGGALSFERSDDPARHPVWCWAVQSKAGLQALVDYFDRFPLRAKKARDYAIWRRGVEVYSASRRPSEIAAEMEELRAALIGTRVFARDHVTERLIVPNGVG